jgi:hypothetical protein
MHKLFVGCLKLNDPPLRSCTGCADTVVTSSHQNTSPHLALQVNLPAPEVEQALRLLAFRHLGLGAGSRLSQHLDDKLAALQEGKKERSQTDDEEGVIHKY